MSIKDKKITKDELLTEAGLNSVYRNHIKSIDRGLLGGNKVPTILSREKLEAAEKCFSDPQVSTCFLLLVFSLMKKTVVFEGVQEGKKTDIKKSKEAADFLNFSLKKLQDGGVRQLQYDMLTSKFFGWSLVEKVYDILTEKQTSKYKQFYYYSACKAKRIGLWDFSYDINDNVVGYISLLDKNKKVWSKKKFIQLSYLPLFNNKNGTGDFERVWRFWDAKVEFIIFVLTLGARLAKGRQALLKNNGSNNTSTTDSEIDEILEALIDNLSIYIPAGFDVDFSNFDVNALQYFLAILRWLDSQIAIAMIGSSLAVNESQGAGTNAQSTVHMQNTFTFEDYAEGLICDALDESYARDLLELNYNLPEELWPKSKLVLPDNSSDTENITMYEKLKAMGVLDLDTEIDLNFLREKFNLPDNPELFDNVERIINNAINTNDNTDNNLDNNSEDGMYINSLAPFYDI